MTADISSPRSKRTGWRLALCGLAMAAAALGGFRVGADATPPPPADPGIGIAFGAGEPFDVP